MPDRHDHEGMRVRNAVRPDIQAYVNYTFICIDVDIKLLGFGMLIRLLFESRGASV